MASEPYSEKELAFIRENYGTCSAAELAERVSSRFHTHRTAQALRNLAQKYRFVTRNHDIPLTPEEKQWIRDNFKAFKTSTELCICFNKTFHRNTNTDTMRGALRKMGLTYNFRFSKEQHLWLHQNIIKGKPRKDILEEYNKLFPQHPLTLRNLTSYAFAYGLSCTMAEIRRYVNPTTVPVGSLQRRGKQPYIKFQASPVARNNWKLAKVYVWEKVNNKSLPKDWAVVCLDGNEYNLSIDNLYAVPREKVVCSVAVTLGHNPHLKNNAEIKKILLQIREINKILEEGGYV